MWWRIAWAASTCLVGDEMGRPPPAAECRRRNRLCIVGPQLGPTDRLTNLTDRFDPSTPLSQPQAQRRKASPANFLEQAAACLGAELVDGALPCAAFLAPGKGDVAGELGSNGRGVCVVEMVRTGALEARWGRGGCRIVSIAWTRMQTHTRTRTYIHTGVVLKALLCEATFGLVMDAWCVC